MGGIGSGRYGRRSPRRRVEELHYLPVAELHRAIILAGHDETPSVTTQWVGNDDVVIHFESTQQHFGGSRWWFLCPRCGKRRTRLYHLRSAPIPYACRVCHRLRYKSQCVSMPERWRHRANVLFRRAGCHASDSYYYKPKWMRWTTFNNLIERAEELDEAHAAYGLWRIFQRKDFRLAT